LSVFCNREKSAKAVGVQLSVANALPQNGAVGA